MIFFLVGFFVVVLHIEALRAKRGRNEGGGRRQGEVKSEASGEAVESHSAKKCTEGYEKAGNRAWETGGLYVRLRLRERAGGTLVPTTSLHGALTRANRPRKHNTLCG